eukprot:TRINITY_DN17215_c0_g2_i1.p2 TRINITY_DN17215_c0_g2~~TRINITY_DN17215_c0_g2_i1.p2  ORF type:complete len:322 (+),score=57.11 TRINITY_DN17215_c0_g2_i1:85-1050(+)
MAGYQGYPPDRGYYDYPPPGGGGYGGAPMPSSREDRGGYGKGYGDYPPHGPPHGYGGGYGPPPGYGGGGGGYGPPPGYGGPPGGGYGGPPPGYGGGDRGYPPPGYGDPYGYPPHGGGYGPPPGYGQGYPPHDPHWGPPPGKGGWHDYPPPGGWGGEPRQVAPPAWQDGPRPTSRAGGPARGHSRSRSPARGPAPEATPGPPLERHQGAERDNKPAWMTKGVGIGNEMFGETKGDLVKPGMTKADLERIEQQGPCFDGPDPFGDVFREKAGDGDAAGGTAESGDAAATVVGPPKRAPLPDQDTFVAQNLGRAPVGTGIKLSD